MPATRQTTFNCMTVDGDTSTSDTCLLFATGAAAKRGQTARARGGRSDARESFSGALHDLLRDLAIQVAKDGEGLTKFVTIEISGAESWRRGAHDRALAAPTRRSSRPPSPARTRTGAAS